MDLRYCRKNWSKTTSVGDESSSETDDDGIKALAPYLESLSPDVSPELARPLSSLSQLLAICYCNLCRKSFDELLLGLEEEIETFWIEQVVERNHFSVTGSGQFEMDVQYGLINGVWRKYVARRSEGHFKK